MENCTARRIRKTLTDGSYRFASKSLHSDPKWPFTATLPVNSNTNLLVAESPAVLRETWVMGEGGIHHLSRKVRSPLSVQISLTHSLAAFCCSPARTTETESQFKPEIKSPEKKKLIQVGEARCVMAVALRHTLYFPYLLTFTAARPVSVSTADFLNTDTLDPRRRRDRIARILNPQDLLCFFYAAARSPRILGREEVWLL